MSIVDSVKREDNDTRRLCSGIMRMAASYPSGPAAASSFDLRGQGGDTNIVHLFGQQQNRSAAGVAASPGFGSNGNFYTINSLHMVGNNFPIEGIFGSYYSPELSYNYLNTVADALNNILKTAPNWMLNQQKDSEIGKDIHYIGSEIEMKLRDEINIMKKIRSYKGIRHERGLTVRGQRTRANNRKGLTLGVSKKGVQKK